jgi:hypothetical protein
MRLIVASAVLETLESMDMSYPEVSDERRAELASYRDKLAAD